MSPAREDRAERFAELYNASYGAIYAYASRRVGAGAADEIAAETFLVAWRGFEGLPSEPLPWLFGVARNVVMRYRTASGRQQRVRAALIHERTFEQPEVDGLEDPRLADAWLRLRPGDREVLALVALRRRRRPCPRLLCACLLGARASRASTTRAPAQRLLGPDPFNHALGGLMSAATPDTISRLRAANPAPVERDRADRAVAQAALQRILADPVAPRASAPRRRRRSPRGLALVLAAMAIGGGAAVAATNPFGWWSASPDGARYAANPALHVRTPRASEISCPKQPARSVRCGAGESGQKYVRGGAIEPPDSSSFSRSRLSAATTQALAHGLVSAAAAARMRADLDAVPNSFFTKLRVASRFGTPSAGAEHGRELAPPAGVPEFLVCEQAGSSLSCQNLNGDENAPVGAGIYQAIRAPDWRVVAVPRQRLPLLPGISFDAAEDRVLGDLLRVASSVSATGSGGERAHAVPSPPASALNEARTR